ncbi:hypothetical protein LIER_16577 [Lithospermum erythrorhizon]|uniref:Uncharacterized protein n=1 Tax=Lithospermum erythrorhizon TaxID=34254 RepID=A0AAV3Q783_LITER
MSVETNRTISSAKLRGQNGSVKERSAKITISKPSHPSLTPQHIQFRLANFNQLTTQISLQCDVFLAQMTSKYTPVYFQQPLTTASNPATDIRKLFFVQAAQTLFSQLQLL